MTSARAYAGQAIFGASDGVMSILGPVMFAAARWPRLVFPIALMGAVSAAASMAAGQAMSDSKPAKGAVITMGAATFAGSVLPATPFLITRGVAALIGAAVLVLAVALIVAHLRWVKSGCRYGETLAILAAVLAVTIGCNLLMPGGAL